MAEVKVQEERKEINKTGIVIGAAVLCGATCIAIGYSLGRNIMTDDETVIRAYLYNAKQDGEQILHWINPDKSISNYVIKYLGTAAK